MATKKTQIKYKFSCEPCKFYTNNNYDFKRHQGTKKHEKAIQLTKSSTGIQDEELFVCECGRFYKERTGLWRHKKKCKSVENQLTVTEEEEQEEEELN